MEVEFFFACLTPRLRGMACLWRGPLLYSLPVKGTLGEAGICAGRVERKFPYCDYEILRSRHGTTTDLPGKIFYQRSMALGKFHFP